MKKYLVFKTLNHSSTMLDDRDRIFPFIDFYLLSDFFIRQVPPPTLPPSLCKRRLSLVPR